MFPYIFALKNQGTQTQVQLSGETRKTRQLQNVVAGLQQSATATQESLNQVADTAHRADPKITALGQNLAESASDLGNRISTTKDLLRQSNTRLTSAEIKADQALTNTVALSANLESVKRDAQIQSEKIIGVESAISIVQAEERQEASKLATHLAMHDASILRFAEALSGNIKLYAEAITEELSAAALNAAAAGTFTRDLTVSLVSQMGEGETAVRYVHPWALLPAVITAEAAADPDINPPVVKNHDEPLATPEFVSGLLKLLVVMDTDAGVTKTYAPEDELTVTVKVSADSKLLGWTVADFVMTYTVVA